MISQPLSGGGLIGEPSWQVRGNGVATACPPLGKPFPRPSAASLYYIAT